VYSWPDSELLRDEIEKHGREHPRTGGGGPLVRTPTVPRCRGTVGVLDDDVLDPLEALRGGIPCSFLEPFRGHFLPNVDDIS
jgi:hypothetical protein